MVGLVSLLVIGPERLPKAARIAGYWLGKARSTVAHFKQEIAMELHAEELRQALRKPMEFQEELERDISLQQILHSSETHAPMSPSSDEPPHESPRAQS